MNLGNNTFEKGLLAHTIVWIKNVFENFRNSADSEIFFQSAPKCSFHNQIC